MITVNREEFLAAQKALADILEKEYAIINQSPTKIENLTSRILLHKNHHALKSTISVETALPVIGTVDINELRKKLYDACLEINVGGAPLIDYRKCDNCNHVDSEDDMLPAKDLSHRLGDGDDYSDLECPHCGALSYKIGHCINKGDFDFLLKQDNKEEYCSQDFSDMADYYMAEYSGNHDESYVADALRLLLLRADYLATEGTADSPLGFAVNYVIETLAQKDAPRTHLKAKYLLVVAANKLNADGVFSARDFLAACLDSHKILQGS